MAVRTFTVGNGVLNGVGVEYVARFSGVRSRSMVLVVAIVFVRILSFQSFRTVRSNFLFFAASVSWFVNFRDLCNEKQNFVWEHERMPLSMFCGACRCVLHVIIDCEGHCLG